MVEGGQDADGAVFIGYHARAGSRQAVMDHTISGAQVHNWRMNGQAVSEAEINAALLGFYGVPVLMASGDDRLADEIQERLPGVATMIVKYALDHRAERSNPRAEVFRGIRETCRAAVMAVSKAPVFRLRGPVTFELEFTRSFYAETAALMPT
ncbi:MAG: M55 family metallopeptidase, partial [Firmicutes bacterium]|nr:M55 family metallopeptidase [Bacillota bacterium]